jgi:hypothetical protein
MASKKAQSIFHDTYQTLDSYVRKGKKFDCLSNVCCTTRYTITKSTIKDLEQLCMIEFHRAERNIKWHGEKYPRRVEREVEVARRMWLTIQSAAKDVEKWGEILSA